MIPKDTIYRLADPKDHRAIKALWKKRDDMGEPKPLGWPTIVAERKSRVVGFLSTWPDDDVIIAGPLVTDKKISQPAFVAMRLIEAYEIILKTAGVTFYNFGVPKTHATYLASIKSLGINQYSETEDEYWFKKEIA